MHRCSTLKKWELIIIGAGPAGLSAGIYGARSGLKTLILDEKMAGGTTSEIPIVENYPGVGSISGSRLADRMAVQCRSFGVEIHEIEKVASLDLQDDKKIVKTDRAKYKAKAVILASGAHYRELNVPGEKEFRGKGVSYCGVCDGPFFKNKRVIVVGGGNSAAMTALYVADLASKVKLLHRRKMLRAEEALLSALNKKKNVQILWNIELRKISGEKTVNKVTLFNNMTNKTKEMEVDGVFIQVGETPNSQLAKDAGIKVDDEGYVKADARQRTNIAGVYAVGDVTNHPVKQIGTAVGQGITAAIEAYGYIRQPYYYKS